jgi:hypothetical protein
VSQPPESTTLRFSMDEASTYHVDPGPIAGIPTPALAQEYSQQSYDKGAYDEPPKDGQHRPTNSLRPAHGKSPYAREEL